MEKDKEPVWVMALDPYNMQKHHNAIDLNFRPVAEKSHYRIPQWMGNYIVDLSMSGQTQHKILIHSLVDVVSSFESLAKKAKEATTSYEQEEFYHDLGSFQNKMEALEAELF